MVLPSYQQFLEREHHLKGAKANESEALIQFGKTILMLILARVNDYYSPYTAQTIKEEEDRCYFGSVFTHSEQEFFKHKLQSKFPKINNKSLDTALTFLMKQKLANCPCQVHTKTRGYDWVVFRRQPDRTPKLYYEQTESESEEEIHEEYEDDDYFSVEPVDIENDEKKEDQDVTGAAAPGSSELPADESAKKSESGDNTSIHSREEEEEEEKKSQKKSERDKEDMESQNSDDTDVQMDTKRGRTNYICFKTSDVL